jgi:hypothetical protein
MDDLTDDELLADMISAVALDVLGSIGSDPEARYQFFRQYIELAKLTVAREPVARSGMAYP